jgi:hypothetical protein
MTHPDPAQAQIFRFRADNRWDERDWFDEWAKLAMPSDSLGEIIFLDEQQAAGALPARASSG